MRMRDDSELRQQAVTTARYVSKLWRQRAGAEDGGSDAQSRAAEDAGKYFQWGGEEQATGTRQLCKGWFVTESQLKFVFLQYFQLLLVS